jgi:probable HAF family extracellular repeat protein
MRTTAQGWWWPLVMVVALTACTDEATAPPTAAPRARAAAALSTEGCTIRRTNLGTLGGSTSAAHDVNLLGQIVGESQTAGGQTHAFLWARGRMTDLGTLGGATSIAHAINNRGAVVGESETAGGEVHAFLWERGVMTDLNVRHSELGDGPTRARDINRRGDITGTIDLHGFVISSGAVQELFPPGGSPELIPHAINDRGVLAGFLSDDGFVGETVSDFVAINIGGAHSRALDLNARGEVVGSGDVPSGLTRHAFLHRDGVTKDIGTLASDLDPSDPAYPPDVFSEARGINPFGQVVGESDTDPVSGSPRVAFLWWQGTMTNLGMLPGYASSTADAINAVGQIAGWSTTGGGRRRATLWTLGRPLSPVCWGDPASGPFPLAATGNAGE